MRLPATGDKQGTPQRLAPPAGKALRQAVAALALELKVLDRDRERVRHRHRD